MRRALPWIAAAAAAAVAIVLPACDDEPTAPERAQAPERAPNLLVVMTDDQNLGSFTGDVMPRTREFFADEGTVFEQAIAVPPLCCPARAGFLTGRYAHNHRVLENQVGYENMTGKDSTLAVALQAGGYRTGMVGKFLHGYERVAGAELAPGFDRWYTIMGAANYFDFQVSDDGEPKRVPGYATDDLTDQAVDFTAEASADDVPFFLWLAYNAPHTVQPGSSGPCSGLAAQPRTPEDFDRFAREPLPRPGSFGEADVADKPSLGGGPGPLRRGQIEEATTAWRCSLAAVAAVDEQFGRLMDELRELGELDETVVVFLSDNGLYYGEHRLTDDKRLPLEPALRVPFAVRVGAGVRGEAPPPTVPELVSQVDLAPTLLDYARAPACPEGAECEPLDGRSLRPLLEGKADWPPDRAIPLELDEGWTYQALRTPAELYMELAASRWREFDPPAAELYELRSDPDQLRNLAEDPASSARLAELSARLRTLSECSGIESRDPRGERPYCE